MKQDDLQVLRQNAIAAHRSGDLVRAIGLYEEALIHEPNRPELLFNLGLVLIALKQMERAAYCYEEVIKIDPDHASAHYYLANCCFSLEKFAEAQRQYEIVLSHDPSHVDALNNLGALLLHEKNYEHAIQCFSAVLATHPEHLEARNNLGATLMQLNRYYHAAEHFRYILAHHPEDISVRYSYAMSLLDSGDFAEAINQFEQVLQIKSDHLNAQSNLGIAVLKAGNIDKAKDIFKRVLEQQPDNTEINYLYCAITGRSPPDLPPSTYVKNLFDHYAKHYEQHVIDTLHYTVPQQLRQLLEKYVLSQPNREWQICDLGCGTGLAGLEFRGLAKRLIGVDLSSHMLAIAKAKLIYDELIESDVVQMMATMNMQYDLLLAADTFNYFGDFGALFAACRQALKKLGYLLFSVEDVNEPSSSWMLQPNARYAHNKAYIEQQAEIHGFEVCAITDSVLRQQENRPVKGWLCLLRKN
jgi:predicted TPR repeat methyltransferase